MKVLMTQETNSVEDVKEYEVIKQLQNIFEEFRTFDDNVDLSATFKENMFLFEKVVEKDKSIDLADLPDNSDVDHQI